MRGNRVLVALIRCLSAGWAYSADDGCAQLEHVVRVDEKNERLFIEASADPHGVPLFQNTFEMCRQSSCASF